MTEPTVAVIIPTYNRRDWTLRAVESVVAQTRAPNEIVVVDDGSTDDTAEAVQQEFPEVRVGAIEHGGVSRARNHGVDSTTSHWLAFLDSDDQWQPEKLEVQLQAMHQSGYRIGHCEETWIRNGRRVNPRDRHKKWGGFIYRHCLPLCCISPSAVILERSLFEEVGGFNESLPACEDYDLWLRICCQLPVCFVDQPLVVKYGGHDDQLSRTTEALDQYRVMALEHAYRISALSAGDRVATLETLVEKLEVLSPGAQKRGLAVAKVYRRKLQHYTHLLGLERHWVLFFDSSLGGWVDQRVASS